MIEDGLPDSREGWPDGVLEAIGTFVLGDVIDGPPIFYFADPRVPVWEATKHALIDEADVVVLDGMSKALITSQTCDVGEEDADPPMKPFVMVAPVYDAADILDGGTRSLLKRGRGPAYLVYLPALEPGFWVADLRIELPVEKGWLAGHVDAAVIP